MKINVLLCDTFPGRLPNDIPTYMSMHERMFRVAVGEVQFKVYMAMDEELPTIFNRDEMYLIPGCLNSAYDPLPWIEKLHAWVREAYSCQMFLVGICFGHQVIARALGGTVEHYSGGWGVGVRESTVIDPLLRESFNDGKLRLLYNHHDQVITLPRDAVTMATSDFCRHEAMRIGNHVFTFQGHPEYTPYYIRYYLNNLSDGQDPVIRERALLSLDSMTPQGVDVARWIAAMFDRWQNN